MGSGFAKQKKQARAFQDQMAKMQAEMNAMEVEASAGGGLVKVTMNGEHQILKVAIKPDCVDPEDIEGLEDLVKAACNDAAKQIQEKASSGLGGFGAFGL